MPTTQKKIEQGSATSAIAVALLALVILIAAITLEERDKRMAQEAYDRELHTSQETEAYKFSEQKNRVNQTKLACDKNIANHQALRIWIEQQNFKVKPPPELLIDFSCAAVVEKE